MLKLIQIDENSQLISDICQLLNKYQGLIFYYSLNPVKSFLIELCMKKIVVIAALKNNNFIAFLVLYKFQKVSQEKFNCYMYGAAKRGFAVDLDASLNFIFSDLKEKGCIVVRCETKECNMPMRKMANRLGFDKIAILKNTYIKNGVFKNSILYEKIL